MLKIFKVLLRLTFATPRGLPRGSCRSDKRFSFIRDQIKFVEDTKIYGVEMMREGKKQSLNSRFPDEGTLKMTFQP